MTVTSVNLAGRKVLVTRPNGVQYGHLGLEMLMTLAQAKAERAAVFFLPPPVIANEALFALTTDDVQILHPPALLRAWFRCRWQVKDLAIVGAERLEASSNSFWHELYRELRRHAGDERFPVSLRETLRRLSQWAVTIKTGADHDVRRPYYRRRLLRERIATYLPPHLADQARETAAAIGIACGAPIVSVHAREPGYKRGREVPDLKAGKQDDSFRNARIETYFDAIDHLVSQGYTVVRLGDAWMAPVRRPGMIDLATSPQRTSAVEVLVLSMSEFVVCGDSGLHAVSYLTNTPCLTVNATDPYSSYPIRPDGLYILKKVVDLDTGRTLTLRELLSEACFRNLRNPTRYGYRDNTSQEIAEAVVEMQAGLRRGWHESDSQTRCRDLIVEAGTTLGRRIRYVARWGPDSGFIGDGRVAKICADRLL
jgi:putative glycosyltransferase (TIGR04372 family)